MPPCSLARASPRTFSPHTAFRGHGSTTRWQALRRPQLPGDSLEFLALPDGSLFVDDELPDGALDPLADTLSVPPPYHAFAERQDGSIWTVAARRTSVVEVTEEVPGDEVDMAVNEDERSVHVDGAEFDGEIPSLEDFAAQQFGSFVLRASRLDETLWEVTVLPL